MKYIAMPVSALALALIACTAAAQEIEVTEEKPFGAEVGLGLMITSGNTDTESLNGTVRLGYLTTRWRHGVRFEAVRSSTDDVRTAERYLAAAKSDYRLDEANYLFVTVSYEDDRFSGYDFQASEAIGYGRTVLPGPRVHLDLEAGVGARQNRLEDSGETESEGMVRFAGTFAWNISENAAFTQELSTEVGEDLTVTNSVSALSTRIVGNLAAKLAYRVRYITEVPPDVEKRDTETTVNLVYTF